MDVVLLINVVIHAVILVVNLVAILVVTLVANLLVTLVVDLVVIVVANLLVILVVLVAAKNITTNTINIISIAKNVINAVAVNVVRKMIAVVHLIRDVHSSIGFVVKNPKDF